MRKLFKVGETLKMRNMNNGKEISVSVDYVSGRRVHIQSKENINLRDLKYYKKLGTYTSSEGMTNGKCSDRWILA